SFTPWPALGGGVLIGLAAGWLALSVGRIAGVSGIVGGLLEPRTGQGRADQTWRLAFVLGLVASPWVYTWLVAPPSPPRIEAGHLTLALAGLLVGVGTRLGSGCTSGHGVCGLSRLSPRSLTATLVFMAVGFATVYVLRHVLG